MNGEKLCAVYYDIEVSQEKLCAVFQKIIWINENLWCTLEDGKSALLWLTGENIGK